MKVIRVEPGPVFKDLIGISAGNTYKYELWNELKLRYMGSGKASISIVLEYLRTTKELPDKMSEIIVPSWIGNPVYHQINWFGFPTLHYTKNTKAIMIYHQYGFPQDMDRLIKFAKDRNLIIIEDCAHAPRSHYKGKICGSFGRFSIYSFSKFCFCYALGGVSYKEEQFEQFMEDRLKTSSKLSRFLINFLKFVDETNLSHSKPLYSKEISVLRKAAFGVYGDAHDPSNRSIMLWQDKRETELIRRKKYYQEFINKTRKHGICTHLESDGVIPYAIPIRFDEIKMGALVDKLLEIGIRTSINHFDFNRCHIDPDFRKTVLIPCHGGYTEMKFSQMIDVVNSVVKGIC